MAMEDRLSYHNCELLGRYLDGKASELDEASIRYGLCTSLCELVLVSVKAISLIKLNNDEKEKDTNN